MKNTLLTTTAIAVTGFAGAANAVDVTAGALTMGIGGYFTNTIAYASVDTNPGGFLGAGADFDGIDIHTNAEIHFKPSLTLDNGITIGADVQLEAGSNTNGDQIDESYMFIKGDFGQVLIGSENSAGYKMTVAAPDVSHLFAQSSSLTGYVPYSGFARGADFFRGTLGATYIENNRNNDANRITYFSPRFSGLQLGVSYAADSGQVNGAVNRNTAVTDIIDIGANYSGSFGGVDINASARYGTATGNPTAAVTTDPEIWGGGLSLGFSGFTIGGSYAEQDGTALRDGRSYDVGLGYSNGPWAYSLTYFNGENIDNDAGVPLGSKEQLETIMLAARYTVSPNFKVGAFVANTEFTEDADLAGLSFNDVEGTVVGVSAQFTF
jgi:predicted porin